MIFALSDTHLGKKPMDKFGAEWIKHSEKIKQNWLKTVSDSDIVLIPGDISWAMSFEDAKEDLNFIASLTGKKILLRGNHDYWWKSVSKLNNTYSKYGMYFLQNDCFVIEDGLGVCGARLWTKDKDDDLKIYEREIVRARISLEMSKCKNCDKIIFISHFPPLYNNGEETEINEMLSEYPVIKAVYGHLHGRDNFDYGFKGFKNGIEYKLVSADFVNFKPERIMEVN